MLKPSWGLAPTQIWLALAVLPLLTVVPACSSSAEATSTAAVSAKQSPPPSAKPAKDTEVFGATVSAEDGGSPGPSDPAPLPEPPPEPSIELADGPSPVTVTTETLVVDGSTRSFLLAVPTSYDPAKHYRLLLEIHGDGGTGAGMRAMNPIDAVSGGGAIVAYPNGRNYTWDLYTPFEQNEDQRFLVALVDNLAGRFSISKRHVFGEGYSKGGFIVNQLACRKPSLFRGIVPHAGGAPDEPEDPRASKWPNGYVKCDGQTDTGVAAMVFHGAADRGVTPDSGEFAAMYWAEINGCRHETRPAAPAGCVAYEGCPTGKPVSWCLVPDLGHIVWSKASPHAWAFIKSL